MVNYTTFNVNVYVADEPYLGGMLVSRGEISVGDLTSLLLYTVYVGSGLQMLTYVLLATFGWIQLTRVI